MSGKSILAAKNLATRTRAKNRLSFYPSLEERDSNKSSVIRQTDVSYQLDAVDAKAAPTSNTSLSANERHPMRSAKTMPRQSLARSKRQEHGGQEIVQYLQEMESRVVSQMVAQMKSEITRMYSAQAFATLHAQDEARIQHALPELATQTAREWQNEQNAVARNDFMQRCDGLLSSHQVADLLGSQAKNRAASANHLKEKSKVLCLRLHGQDVYPAFQFNALAQKPYAEMAQLIQILQRDYEPGWQMALWFTASNGWLNGQTPLALWSSNRSAVLMAAQAEMAAFDA